jgi:hypothetical protein
MSLMGTKVPLARFIAEFNRAYGTEIPYNGGLNLAVIGVIPAACGENGRWLVDPDCAPAVAVRLGMAPVAVPPVAKDGIESPPPPCAPAAAPVEMTSPTRRGRSAVTPQKAGPKPAPGKSARSSRRRAA